MDDNKKQKRIPTRVFNADLASVIGLNEAIVISQLLYWISKSEKENRNNIDGSFWVYNTFESWQEQFPFWSIRTLKRVFASLENSGYIRSGRFNRMSRDQTRWYTVDVKRVNETLVAHGKPTISIVTK